MKAIVKRRAECGLWLAEVPMPEVGVKDVLIRVCKTGICDTDLHVYNWDSWAQKTIPIPMTVGHEFVGEVVEVGSNVVGLCPHHILQRYDRRIEVIICRTQRDLCVLNP